MSFTPSNYSNPFLSGADAGGLYRDQMVTMMARMYNDVSSLYGAGMTIQKAAAPGEKTVAFGRYGLLTYAPERKAIGGVPKEGTQAPQDTVLVSVLPSEWQRWAVDEELRLDAPWDIVAPKVENALRRAREMYDRRWLRVATQTANASVVAGISSAPQFVQYLVASPGATVATQFAITDAAGEALRLKIAELRLAMLNQTEGLDANSFRIVARPQVTASLRASKTFMSVDYNREANLPRAVIGYVEGMPVMEVHESLWPTTDITSDTSEYNVNASNTSTRGTPGLFIVSVQDGVGPIAEALPPSRAGIEARLIPEVDTDSLYIQMRQRYSLKTYVPSRIGTIFIKQS
jgi:hypothetical protein